MEPEQRICNWYPCLKEFTATRTDKIYCSKSCQVSGSQAKARNEPRTKQARKTLHKSLNRYSMDQGYGPFEGKYVSQVDLPSLDKRLRQDEIHRQNLEASK